MFRDKNYINNNLKKYPFDKVLEKKQIKSRYIFGKKLCDN